MTAAFERRLTESSCAGPVPCSGPLTGDPPTCAPEPCCWSVEPTEPVVVAYGAGVNSTAMLVGMWRRGIVPDLILFADTGSEKPETYAYLPIIQEWLRRVGFPPLIIVRRAPIDGINGRYETLEQNCLVNATLPSLAFGRKSCSLKWKREPQDRWVSQWGPAIVAWARGQKVIKLIGYDAGPRDQRRCKLEEDSRYAYLYPLRLWGWDRERCIDEIIRAGLVVPPKSACFFCPATQPEELIELRLKSPDLAARIKVIERVAGPKLRVIEGLWRSTTRRRPGSMTVFLEALDAGVPWVRPEVHGAPAATRRARREAQEPPRSAPPAAAPAEVTKGNAARLAWATRRARAASGGSDVGAAARRAWATRRANEAARNRCEASHAG